MPFGVTTTGFSLKRLADIRSDMVSALSLVVDPNTGNALTPNLDDENDPLVQIVNALCDSLAFTWENLQLAYNQYNPTLASGEGLSSLVQLNGITRNVDETDAALRIRQQQSVAIPSRGMVESIYAAVANVSGVTFCRVHQNTDMLYDHSRSLPAKSVAVVVVGGADNIIATVLYPTIPLGMLSYGHTYYQINDVLGIAHSIGFTRPTSIELFVDVKIRVVNAGEFPSNGRDLIKQAILNYAEAGAAAIGIPASAGFDQKGFIPGTPVYSSELYVPVNSVTGIKIESLLVSKNSPPTEPTDVEVYINWDEVALFSLNNIAVSILV